MIQMSEQSDADTVNSVHDIVRRDRIAEKLASLTFVEWDRFTMGVWAGEQYLAVYGWIERDEDDYKDFVLIFFWPESRRLRFNTSSEEYSERIHEILFDDPAEGHNLCHRVENSFDVPNAIALDSEARNQ